MSFISVARSICLLKPVSSLNPVNINDIKPYVLIFCVNLERILMTTHFRMTWAPRDADIKPPQLPGLHSGYFSAPVPCDLRGEGRGDSAAFAQSGCEWPCDALHFEASMGGVAGPPIPPAGPQNWDPKSLGVCGNANFTASGVGEVSPQFLWRWHGRRITLEGILQLCQHFQAPSRKGNSIV